MKNSLIACIITFVLTMVGNEYYYVSSNAVDKIDVRIENDDDFLSQPKFSGKDVTIRVNAGKETEDITELKLLKIYLYNFSRKSYTDLAVTLFLCDLDKKTFDTYHITSLVIKIEKML